MCPYHQWTYDLKGNLIGVPFRRGVKKQGGMPADFDPARARPAPAQGRARATAWSSRPSPTTSSRSRTISARRCWRSSTASFDGRELTVLGYSRQLIPANWKLMFENIKDPYHASLLHVFLVSFGLFRADQPSKIEMDSTGRHGALISWRGEQKKTDDNADMKIADRQFQLERSGAAAIRCASFRNTRW